jgi:hypothetical protein
LSDPRAEYAQRLESYARRIAAENRRHLYLGNAKLAAIAAELLGVWLVLARSLFPPYWLLLPVAVYLILAVLHEFTLRARNRAKVASDFYLRGLARIADRWAGTGQTGERFLERKYLYAEDLDLFGRGSLFELLSQARLPMGENLLAEWLCAPSALETILERQGLVAELREKLELREYLAVTGEALRLRLSPESLTEWAEASPLLPTGPWRAVALLLSLAAAAALILFFGHRDLYTPLLAVLVVEVFFRRRLRPRAEQVMHGVACNAEGLLLFAQVLERFERENFSSPKLQAMAANLRGEGANRPAASQLLRKLTRIVYWIDGEHSLLGHLAELPFLYSVQVAYTAEAWRRRWGRELRTWAAVAGEMEALLSLAAYAYEHPVDPFPQFVETKGTPHAAALFHGEDLGHPLLPADKSVRNSVSLDQETRVLLVSGSNMSGKSTFLRTVGINAVLATAGAPIRGKSLRLTALALGTRIRSGDSLLEGRSNFYTEILHIRRVFERMRQNQLPLLFLFDELLEGTNSHDRRIGAQSLLQALLKNGAIGIVTTHDLTLTEIGAALSAPLRNMHFADQVVNGEMRFDYQLRDGIVSKSNALELMRLVGLEM